MFEIFSVLAIIISLSILVIIHEFGHFWAAKRLGILVEEFGFGFPPRIWGKKFGDTLYSLNWIPFGGFVKIFGMDKREIYIDKNQANLSFNARSIFERAIVIIAGIVMNFVAGWFLISIVFMIGSPQSLVITGIKDGSIAATSDLRQNDMLVDFKKAEDLTGFLDKNKGKNVILNVKRGGQELKINVIPRVNVPSGEGNLGIYINEAGVSRMSFFRSFYDGIIYAAKMTWLIIQGFVDLIIKAVTGNNVFNSFIGPVGLVNLAEGASTYGFANLIHLFALISLNLAVFNLLPLPVLDGGWLLLLFIEKIRGKTLSVKKETIFNSIGFILLGLLAIIVTVKDVWNLF